MIFKEAVYNKALEIITAKISSVQKALDELKESVKNETKSTAGDKYETARAMIHIEQENMGKQLADAQSQKAALMKTGLQPAAMLVVNGSLVQTTKGYLFISIGLGKIKLDDQTVFVLSPQSPLGGQLMGLKVGDVASVNGMKYEVKGIE